MQRYGRPDAIICCRLESPPRQLWIGGFIGVLQGVARNPLPAFDTERMSRSAPF